MPISAVATWPLMHTTGTESHMASSSPVTVLLTPGPEVTNTTPGRPVERAFFLKTAQRSLKPEQAAQITERDFLVIAPAFTVSELSVAFEIGFLIFLPFLVIDLVISNVLMAMGMQMLSPTTVSMPFKLLLFVLIDGWVKLTHGLVLTYV